MNTATIWVGSKEYSLLFGYTCYKLFIARCFMFKDTYLTPAGELTMLGLSNLFHAAYLNACYDKGASVVLSYDDMSEWLDQKYENEEGEKVIIALLDVWVKSKWVKKMQEEIEKKSPVIQEEMETEVPISTI